MIKRSRRKTSRRNVTMEIKDFRGGSNHLLDEARLQPNEAKQATNLMQVQDGLWKPRWGTAYYGVEYADTIDGAGEYLKADGTTETIVVAGGKAYKSTDGGTATEITGATFTHDLQCYFLQISNYLYIANGTDPLVRYDGSVLTTYTELSAPSGLAASRVASGLTSGTHTYYAEVTALNEVGETVGSSEACITVNKLRDTWTASTDKIVWYWNSVSSASRYQLYIAPETGDEMLLGSVSAPTTNFTDDGSIVLNEYVVPPLQNTTTAPRFKSMCLSGNRIWGTNDPNNKYVVYFSGTGSMMGNFSDFYGGGWIALERGGREMPSVVKHYQSGTGDGRLTVLARTPDGRGAIWQINIELMTVDGTTFSVPNAIKVVGSFGTDAVLGAVSTNNDVLFPNKNGVYALGPEKQYYGILRTTELTSRIRTYWRALIGSKLDKIASYFYDSKVFISVPTTTVGNTRTIIYDLERQNWTVDWSIAAKQWLEYTDSSGKTHLLYVPVSGTKLIELSENISGDLGTAFSTAYVSGRMQLAKLWKDFTKLTKVFIKLGNPKGVINFEVSGTGKNTSFKSLGSATIVPSSSNTGMGYDLMGNVGMGSTNGAPSTFADSSDPRYIKIRKKLRDIQLRVTSNSYDTDYVLQGFIMEGNTIKVNPPSAWKAN